MSLLRTLLQIGAVGFFFALCQAATPAAFEDQFFEPVRVSPLGVSPDILTRLTPEEMNDLTHARQVLGAFFRRLERPSGNPLELITPQYAHEKPNRLAIRKALIADETSVLEVGLTDFKVLNPNSLELRFYALITTEGTLAVGEGKAELNRLSGTWKIAHIEVEGSPH
jgi:hypothetical protein